MEPNCCVRRKTAHPPPVRVISVGVVGVIGWGYDPDHACILFFCLVGRLALTDVVWVGFCLTSPMSVGAPSLTGAGGRCAGGRCDRMEAMTLHVLASFLFHSWVGNMAPTGAVWVGFCREVGALP